MAKKDLYKNFSDYENKIHRDGRIWVIICEGLFVLAPITVAIYLKAPPIWNAFFTAFSIIAAIYWTSAIAEYALYAPLLGPAATYLSSITGNIANIKMPCALNAQQIAKTKQGTEENEIVATIAVAVSALTQTAIMVLGVILLGIFSKQFQSFLSNPVVTPIFDVILPTLFGALAVQYILKRPKLGIVPIAFVVIMFLAVPGFANENNVAIMIFVTALVSLISAILMFKYKFVK